MFWEWLSPDQWTAFGTVLSAAVAALNLIVVFILVRYNKRTIDILKEQSSDTRAQAAVALETLSQLKEDRRLLNGRRVLRAYGRLQDLNDIFLVARGEIEKDLFKAEGHNPLMPDDWHDISIAVMESWPQGIERTAILERKIREIQMDISFLCSSLNPRTTKDGVAHLDQLLTEALELLREIGPQMLHNVIEQ
jgi:hypothetical protein